MSMCRVWVCDHSMIAILFTIALSPHFEMEVVSAFVQSPVPLFREPRRYVFDRFSKVHRFHQPTPTLQTRRSTICPINQTSLPLLPEKSASAASSISYGQLLEQAAGAIEELSASTSAPRSLRVSVDFPPERNETRAGTLVSRYENNLNFMSKLVTRLGGNPDTAKRLGPVVEIRDNVNPQGGGEYLTDDECLVGMRVAAAPTLDGRCVTLLLNTGVDASTLKQIKQYDEDDDGVVVLINCALDRMSWFAKLSFAKYVDSFRPAYYLKVIATGGWFIKSGMEPWTVFANSKEGPVLILQSEERPSLVDVEAMVRLKVAGL